MSLAVLLGENNKVTILDIDQVRVDKVNSAVSTVSDELIELSLKEQNLSVRATLCTTAAFDNSDYVVIATPTDYDETSHRFDTESVDSTVAKVMEINSHCLIVIKSTIPVGHTDALRKKHKTNRIIFSPEFLREGQALYDNLYPSRIIIGGECKQSKTFGRLLVDAAKKRCVDLLFVGSREAESIKLFSNTYLAMRVSFFNELDSYALSNNLDAKSIIEGVCLDERIGKGYNNPSLGYGGYCLPKDTKQLLANYEYVPQNLIKAVVLSNQTRKDFIASEILKCNPSVIGVFRLVMKVGSDNFRSSAIIGILNILKAHDIKIIIYEPLLSHSTFDGLKIINELETFKNASDLIITNRMSSELEDVREKCFSRDIFGDN